MTKTKKTTPPDKNFSKRYLHDELTNFENALDIVSKEGSRGDIIQAAIILARLNQLEANIVAELKNIFAPLQQSNQQAQQKETK